MNFTNLRLFMDEMVRTRTPGCAITVYHENEKVFEYAAGVSSLETGERLRGDEFFNIYSCSKIMTVTTALTLLERGIFLLSDPLYDFIPEYRTMKVRQPDSSLTDATRPITIGDLFSMTAGLNYDINSPSIRRARELNPKMPTGFVARAIAGEPLSFEPGKKWQYSLCHDVLAGLVSIVAGKPFREYVREAVLEPLGMTETVYHATPETLARTAEQYRFIANGQGIDADLVELQRCGHATEGKFLNVGKQIANYVLGEEYDSGGAGITTTCGDYAKLIAALANGGLGANGERILSAQTVDLMKTNRLNDEQLSCFNWNQLAGYGYGLGVRTHIDRVKSGSNALLGEFGWGGAAGATAVIDSNLKFGAFFVQHTLNPREEWYQPRLRNVLYGCY